MPLCDVGKYQTGGDAVINNVVKVFYRTFGAGPIKVLMIIGLAATHDSWNPQIEGLVGSVKANEDDDDRTANERGIEVCAIDNRGVGRSSIPTKRSEYTTKIMAKDAIAVKDHLGWKKAHVFGHSMGGMITSKLAGLFPDRMQSLALLNVTGGGFECFPKLLYFHQ